MGWLFTDGSTCKSQIRELTQPFERTHADGSKTIRSCIAHCYRRNNPGNGVLWSVHHVALYKSDGTVDGEKKFIECDLLQYSKRCGGWGYKPMDEGDGPNEVNCPLSYLDMSTINHGHAVEWKQRVREYHAQKAAEDAVRKSLKRGDYLKLKRCAIDMVRVVQTGRTIRGVDMTSGREYKIPRKFIDRLATPEEIATVVR